jgi:hypothetical protein
MSDTTDHENHGTKMAVEQVDNSHTDSGVHVVKRTHADGTVDLIDAHAIGGDLDEMPAGYYLTPNFICTFLVSTLFNIMRPNTDDDHSLSVLPVYAHIWDGFYRQTRFF